jgi:hypothetical protein
MTAPALRTTAQPSDSLGARLAREQATLRARSMAAVVLAAILLLPPFAEMTNGHLGLFMLAAEIRIGAGTINQKGKRIVQRPPLRILPIQPPVGATAQNEFCLCPNPPCHCHRQIHFQKNADFNTHSSSYQHDGLFESHFSKDTVVVFGYAHIAPVIRSVIPRSRKAPPTTPAVSAELTRRNVF